MNDLDFSEITPNPAIKGTAYGDIGPSDEYKNRPSFFTIITIVLVIIIGLVVFLNKKISKKLKIAIIAIVAILGMLFIILKK